jgi:hypothetical protein
LAAEWSTADLAARLGRTPSAIRTSLARAREAYRLAARGGPIGPTLTLAQRRQRVAELAAAGQAPSAIAHTLGVPVSRIYSDLAALARQRTVVTGAPSLFGALPALPPGPSGGWPTPAPTLTVERRAATRHPGRAPAPAALPVTRATAGGRAVQPRVTQQLPLL